MAWRRLATGVRRAEIYIYVFKAVPCVEWYCIVSCHAARRRGGGFSTCACAVGQALSLLCICVIDLTLSSLLISLFGGGGGGGGGGYISYTVLHMTAQSDPPILL